MADKQVEGFNEYKTGFDIPVKVIDNGDNTFSLAVSEQGGGGIGSYSQSAWGINKVVNDYSIIHGMFTTSVPVDKWREEINGVEQSSFVNATSIDGYLNFQPSATLDERITLRTFRNPRYQPNRGHLYSSSIELPNKNTACIRRFGEFTSESGEFFELDENGDLYAVVRTTNNSNTVDDRRLIDVSAFNIDLEKGNVFDIKKQWRGVGNYYFYINLELVLAIEYLGTLTELSTFNPALPIAFECINKGGIAPIQCGCVDITSEGGEKGGLSYGSVSISNESGQVSVSGFNTPIVAIRSKALYNGQLNTRDTLALLLTAYADQRCFLRVWATRDFTAISENDQSWSDFGDGHLEYIEYDIPPVGNEMSFDTTKANLIFGCRVDQDTAYSTSALFEGRTDIYLTPGDMFVFTIHRETGGGCNVGCSFEFGEEI